MFNHVVVIPARLSSTRLPNKPLLKIDDIPMIIRTCKQCNKAVHKSIIFVVTDSIKIYNLVKKNGFNVMMTSKKCKTGTDRIAEFAKKVKSHLYINIQGDEPIIDPNDIKHFINFAKKNKDSPTIGYSKIKNQSEINSITIPKIVIDEKNSLIYISRSPIPANKNNKKNINFYKQICIYSYPKNSLKIYGLDKNKTFLESIEDIEIIRLLEKGYKVKVKELMGNSLAVDTLADLKLVEKIIKKNMKLYE